MKKSFATALVIVAVWAGHANAQSEPQQQTLDVNYAVDGSIIGASLAGAFLLSLLPIDTEKRWDREIFGNLDSSVRGRFNRRAAKISDATLVLTVASPLLEQLGRDVDDQAGRRAMIYGQTFGANLLATAAFKYTFGRPRPYTYGTSDSVLEYTAGAGKDSHVSFFSGHASIAFSSAVSGSLLYAIDSDSTRLRASAWLANMTLAATTAGLRVRAGKHFYSDVFVGALVGSAIGYAVPALHGGDGVSVTPTGLEVGAALGGLALGTLASRLIPIGKGESSIQLAPAAIKGASGISISGVIL